MTDKCKGCWKEIGRPCKRSTFKRECGDMEAVEIYRLAGMVRRRPQPTHILVHPKVWEELKKLKNEIHI